MFYEAPPGPRIDPSQIPSPTALADGRPVKFRTLVGQAPGPAANQYVAIDEANASPRFVRLSMYTIPCTEEVHQTSHIPFAMVVQPLAEVGHGEVRRDVYTRRSCVFSSCLFGVWLWSFYSAQIEWMRWLVSYQTK